MTIVFSDSDELYPRPEVDDRKLGILVMRELGLKEFTIGGQCDPGAPTRSAGEPRWSRKLEIVSGGKPRGYVSELRGVDGPEGIYFGANKYYSPQL